MILVSTDDPKKGLKNVDAFVKQHNLMGGIYLMDEPPAVYLPVINSKWSGSLPTTLVVRNSDGKRSFYDRSLSYKQLLSIINTD